jgi:hypothetical protein
MMNRSSVMLDLSRRSFVRVSYDFVELVRLVRALVEFDFFLPPCLKEPGGLCKFYQRPMMGPRFSSVVICHSFLH